MNTSRLAFILGFLAFTFPLHAHTTYHSKAGFTITLPDNWIQFPDPTVQEFTAKVIPGVASQKTAVDAGFGVNGAALFTFPYILVEIMNHPLGKTPTDEVMRKIIAGTSGGQVNSSLPATTELLKNAKSGAAYFDPNSKAFFISRQTGDSPSNYRIKAYMGRFGKNAMLQVACFGRPDDLEAHQAEIAAIFDSFKLDSDVEIPSLDASERFGRIVGGVIGVAIAIWLVMRFRSRKTKASGLEQ